MNDGIAEKLSVIKWFLTLWTFLTMVAGVILVYFAPSASQCIYLLKIGPEPLSIVVWLILIMYLLLAKSWNIPLSAFEHVSLLHYFKSRKGSNS